MIVQCPYCGARYEAPPGRRFYVCPYCGTVVSEGRTYERVYIFKPSVDKTAAFRTALGFRPVGAPEDLPAASPTGAELHFLPLYLYHVVFEPLPELETYAAALAMSKPPFELPSGYSFPARWRTPFKPSLERVGVFHQPDLEPEAAFRSLEEVVEEARTYASVFKTRVQVEWSFEGIVYYPFWALTYQYGGRSYGALVDGADGSLLRLEYPLSRRGRAEGLALGVAAALGAAAVGALAAFALGLPPSSGAAGGGLAGLGALLRLTAFAAARRGRYEGGARL
ncbi:TFIIB-type zinc ribbon-containing protein [Pyrobaculum neutrophilum]|uniref:Zinc finger TFIIB-type domain protein n=1 Tax=Pyrobaculum neutrophilum (strain DSM 2338 / JCM 9278 / NBRC 100436 / V24Sta) TaxID=444157 RepID=B1YDK2_PYRNV|nr:TFIIB-type zinc ribbon-containing protein [Pyrobaculum neutrophilum]ACB39865.1 Zinc finger TFIIB-type domain protein [Pyrobaculum neutrophilum V24Sta]